MDKEDMNKEDMNKDKYSEEVENTNKKKNKKDDENVMIELPDWNLEPPIDDKEIKNDRGEL